jgi:hypothetical protein
MHFYGLSLQEVREMSMHDAIMLHKSVRVIQAQETLVNMDVSSYPHTKKESRKRIQKSYQQAATIESSKKEDYVSTDAFFRSMTGRINSAN